MKVTTIKQRQTHHLMGDLFVILHGKKENSLNSDCFFKRLQL